ncbi:MAG: hypothetical protein ACI396_09860 [Acutalibacteraceae bacterium]
MKMKRLILVMLALLCVVLAGCKNEQKDFSNIESHDPILCDIAAEPDIYKNMSSEDFLKIINDKNYGDTVKLSDDDLCYAENERGYKAYLIEKKFIYVEINDAKNPENNESRLVYIKNNRISDETMKKSDFEKFIRKYI